MDFWAEKYISLLLKYISQSTLHACVMVKEAGGVSFNHLFIKTSFSVICFHKNKKILTTGIYSGHVENSVSEIQILVFRCYRAVPKPRLLSFGLLVLV